MKQISVTPAALAKLAQAKEAAENELRKMRRVNHAFRLGHSAFLRRGYSSTDYQMFAVTIKRNPDYGPVPFPPRLVFAKLAQIERIDKELTTGRRFISSVPHKQDEEMNHDKSQCAKTYRQVPA